MDDSSLPVAVFQYHLRSLSKKPVELSLAFSLLNAVGYDGKADLEGTRHPGFGKNLATLRQEEAEGVQINGLDLSSTKYAPTDLGYGSIALLTNSPEVTAQTSWAHGDWWDSFQKWYDEFARTGQCMTLDPAKPSEDGRSDYATLAPRLKLQPGESKTITFLLGLVFPVRENYWNDEKEVKGQKLRNYYGTRFQSAWEVGAIRFRG